MAFKFIAQKDYLTFEKGREYRANKSFGENGVVIKDTDRRSPNDGAELMWVPVYRRENEEDDEHFYRVELNIMGDLMDAGVITKESNLTTFK